MSYEGNDLGYDSGYDLESRVPAKTSQQVFSSESNLPTGYGLKADGATAISYDTPKPLHSPDSADGDKPGKEVVALMPDGSIKKFPEGQIPKDASEVQVKLLGKNNNPGGKKNETFLVQYQDAKGNPLKYDEVDGATAKKLGIEPGQLEKAPPIGKGSFFETKVSDLRTVEKNKQTKEADIPTTGPTMTVGEAKQKAGSGIWDEPKDGKGGGYMHRRLSEDYGFNSTQIADFRRAYDTQPPMSQKELDEKIPPMTEDHKRDKAMFTKRKEVTQQKAMAFTIDSQGQQLANKLGIDKGEAKAIIAQRYREEGMDLNEKSSDLRGFTSRKDAVDKWVGTMPDKPKEGIDHPAVASTYKNAYNYEREKTVKTLTPLMPGKDAKEKEVNARLYLAHQKEENGIGTPATLNAFNDDLLQEQKSDEGRRTRKSKIDTFMESIKGPGNAEHKKDLAIKAGTEDPLTQNVDDYTKGLDKKSAEQVKTRVAEARAMKPFEDTKRKEEQKFWHEQQDRIKKDTMEKAEWDKKRDLEFKQKDKENQAFGQLFSQVGQLGMQMIMQPIQQLWTGLSEMVKDSRKPLDAGLQASFAAADAGSWFDRGRGEPPRGRGR